MKYKQKLSIAGALEQGHPSFSKMKSLKSIPNLAFKPSVTRATPAGSAEALIAEPWRKNRRQFAQRSAFAFTQILLHRRLKDNIDVVK